jgi:transposase
MDTSLSPTLGEEVEMKKGGDGKTPRRERRGFSPEFKREAVRLMQERRKDGTPIAQVGRQLGVGPELLRRWERELFGHVPVQDLDPLQEELRRVRRELEVTKQERDFLKKAAAFFAKESP